MLKEGKNVYLAERDNLWSQGRVLKVVCYVKMLIC